VANCGKIYAFAVQIRVIGKMPSTFQRGNSLRAEDHIIFRHKKKMIILPLSLIP